MPVSEAEFGSLVQQAFRELPEVYQDACRGLAIRSENEASREVLSALELSEPSMLLGLYHGVNLTQESVFDLPSLPDEVINYREPTIAYADANGRPPREVIIHVLVHEIGHHFGLSDADMEQIEQDGRS